MTAVPRTSTFKELMTQVDDDYDAVDATEHKRRLLYYSVKLDDRTTDIIARSTLNRNNRPRLTFFIRTPQENSNYTMLYLSEANIISILSTLDDNLYDHIINHLVKVYRNKIGTNAHAVNFSRESLPGSKIQGALITANLDVVVIPEYKEASNVGTTFGYEISFQSFCDDLSLILSTENKEKLKTSIVKYYIFSNMLKGASEGMPIPQGFEKVTTAKDIEEKYEKKGFTKGQEYDSRVFGGQIFSDYFKSLT